MSAAKCPVWVVVCIVISTILALGITGVVLKSIVFDNNAGNCFQVIKEFLFFKFHILEKMQLDFTMSPPANVLGELRKIFSPLHHKGYASRCLTRY